MPTKGGFRRLLSDMLANLAPDGVSLRTAADRSAAFKPIPCDAGQRPVLQGLSNEAEPVQRARSLPER